MNRVSICVLLILFKNLVMAQNATYSLKVNITPYYAHHELYLKDSSFSSNDLDSVEISLFKFYISAIELLQDNKTAFKEENSYHLIDATSDGVKQIQLNLPASLKYNQIKFNVGIDSATNVAGAEGGDLDPMRGMYWTWQSGYINLKLEGTHPHCNTRNHGFTFHLGGYRYPYNTLQSIVLPVINKESITIKADVKKLLQTINLSTTNQMMTPGKGASDLSQQVKAMFSTYE